MGFRDKSKTHAGIVSLFIEKYSDLHLSSQVSACKFENQFLELGHVMFLSRRVKCFKVTKRKEN